MSRTVRQRRLVALTVRNPLPFDRDETIVAGLPAAPGKIAADTPLALCTTAGDALCAQFDWLARWDDGSAKWLLATLPNFAVAAKSSVKLSLHAGIAPQDYCRQVVLRRRPGGLRVNTGRLRFTVADNGPLVPAIDSYVAGRWQRRARNLDLALRVEHHGRSSDYLASRSARTVTVESHGPLRAVLRIDGVHRAEDGSAFGAYALRLELLAGSSGLKLTHSFIFDGDPDQDFIRASEVRVAAVVGTAADILDFGGDDGESVTCRRQAADFCPDLRYAELYQDSVSHWRLQRWVDRERSAVFTAEGHRADGWVALTGARGSLAVAVHDFWQNHPKSLSADAGSGQLCIGLYPRRAERLNLRRYSADAHPWTYEHPAFRGKTPVRADPAMGARGIRKTHDLTLWLDEGRPAAAAAAGNAPLRLQWPQSYTARTGIVVPASRRRHRGWLHRFNHWIDFLKSEMVRCGGTGYLDYFDLPHGFDLASGRWHHDFGGWGYINDEAMPCLGLWQLYLLTGRDDVFAMAKAMSRHNSDIDSYLLGPLAGLGSRHNINHWGDTCKEARISQPIGKRFLYYLTGDCTILDLTRIVVARFERRAAEPRPFNMTCDLPALVAALLLLEESASRPCRDWLLAIADAVAASVSDGGLMNANIELDAGRQTARALPDSGVIGFMMFSCFGGVQALAELAERYDHGPLRAALVRFARYQLLPVRRRQASEAAGPYLQRDWLNTYRALDLFAYAHQVSGTDLFRRRLAENLRRVCVELAERPVARYGVGGAAQRTMPVAQPPPPTAAAARRWQELYPLFPQASSGQFFNMAIYMHKAQAVMYGADQPPGE